MVEKIIPGRRMLAVCKCDCGKATTVRADSLQSGKSASCGCLRDEAAARSGHALAKHGESHAGGRRAASSEYGIWCAMISRCHNPHAAAYPNYGGRGISVCDRWRSSYEAFLADMGRRPAGLTLDRTDNDRGYEPGNCAWRTRSEQNRNRRPRVRATAIA